MIICTVYIWMLAALNAGWLPTVEARHELQLKIGTTAARVLAVDGGIIRISQAGVGTFGLVPRLGDGLLRIQTVAISSSQSAGEDVITPLTEREMSLGDSIALEYHGEPIRIEWVATKQQGTDSDASPCPGDQCCVTCEGITICQCLVEMSCGRCCCPNKCACDFEEQSAASSKK